jgi:hypothetical protein
MLIDFIKHVGRNCHERQNFSMRLRSEKDYVNLRRTTEMLAFQRKQLFQDKEGNIVKHLSMATGMGNAS